MAHIAAIQQDPKRHRGAIFALRRVAFKWTIVPYPFALMNTLNAFTEQEKRTEERMPSRYLEKLVKTGHRCLPTSIRIYRRKYPTRTALANTTTAAILKALALHGATLRTRVLDGNIAFLSTASGKTTNRFASRQGGLRGATALMMK